MPPMSAMNDHAVAKVTIPLMKLRRRIASPQGSGGTPTVPNYTRDLRPVKWASTVILRSNNSEMPMAQLGSVADKIGCPPHFRSAPDNGLTVVASQVMRIAAIGRYSC
jgi:hypothetical protein